MVKSGGDIAISANDRKFRQFFELGCDRGERERLLSEGKCKFRGRMFKILNYQYKAFQRNQPAVLHMLHGDPMLECRESDEL